MVIPFYLVVEYAAQWPNRPFLLAANTITKSDWRRWTLALDLGRRGYQVSVKKCDELVAVGVTVRLIVFGDSFIRMG